MGSGQVSGSTGKSQRVEALRISLTGAIKDYYDIYYRVHVADYGWLDWACNGADAGSTLTPTGDYGMFFDYNTNPIVYGKGSAFFLHCYPRAPWTEGCIAVSRDNMIKIIQTVRPGARLCIY